MWIALFLFWLCFVALVYVYFGYPLAGFLASLVMNKKVLKSSYTPAVTVITAAFNEEKNIEATILNKLRQNYPREQLEMIVVSDASTDATDEIVRKFEAEGVKLIRQERRRGKTAALNRAVPHARGSIIVFSDANSIYEPDTVSKLVRNFHDRFVGYVTGKMVYTNPDGSVVGTGCTAYMRYENVLREIETRLGSVVGVDGGVDAVRAALYRPMNEDQLPDFILPLRVVEQGYRVVYEPEALLGEPALKSARDEYRMRVRVSLRALWALKDMKYLLSPRRYGVFAWELISHKLLRYLSFVFLLGAFFANMALARQSGFFAFLFVLQILFYAAAAAASVLERKGKRITALYVPYYFTLINVAAAHACVKFLLGKKQALWTPRTG